MTRTTNARIAGFTFLFYIAARSRALIKGVPAGRVVTQVEGHAQR